MVACGGQEAELWGAAVTGKGCGNQCKDSATVAVEDGGMRGGMPAGFEGCSGEVIKVKGGGWCRDVGQGFHNEGETHLGGTMPWRMNRLDL